MFAATISFAFITEFGPVQDPESPGEVSHASSSSNSNDQTIARLTEEDVLLGK